MQRRAGVAALACALMVPVGSCTGDDVAARSTGSPEPSASRVTTEPTSSPDETTTARSVVSIETDRSASSGLVVTMDGHILVPGDVVATAGADAVTVTAGSGASGKATVVGTDQRSGLAVVRVDSASGLAAASFGDSTAVETGDEVTLVGSPRPGATTTRAGVVRTTAHVIDGVSMIEVGLTAGPGSGGSPIVNQDDEVIGILMARSSAAGEGGTAQAGFAIPSNLARRVATQLVEGEQVRHPFLGIRAAAADRAGAQVREVVAGSPAADAGLLAGDVISAIGGRRVQDADSLVSVVQSAAPGQQLEVVFRRDGPEQHTTVTLGNAPAG